MCTSGSFTADGEHYFGRNLDLEVTLGQQVVVTPRNYPFRFRYGEEAGSHYAMIGMAVVQNDYPLYFDAVNERGLGVAGLNFTGEAVYNKSAEGKRNVASYELIPWILSSCDTVKSARSLLKDANITDDDFAPGLKATRLHWMVADKDESIVVEQDATGMHVYGDPVGVMTNRPGFPFQMANLAMHMGSSAEQGENRIAPGVNLDAYSRGMGGYGIPGDLSSSSRFVKAAFTRMNSKAGPDGMTQFFHILGSVEQQNGCCDLGGGKCEYTVYSSCCDTGRGIYYYRTYGNSRVRGVDMNRCDLDGGKLSVFPVDDRQDVLMQN